MLIVALILAVIGLAALVTAVVTANEPIAWVCIGASGLGVLLLIVDAIRDRANRRTDAPTAFPAAPVETAGVVESVETAEFVDTVEAEMPYPAEGLTDYIADDIPGEMAGELAEEDHPDELVYDDPDYDTPSDDEADFPEPAEEAAIHTVGESDIEQDADDEIAVGESSPEVRYIVSPEGSDNTVVNSYSEYAETEYAETEYAETEYAETEYADNGDSPVREERGDP